VVDLADGRPEASSIRRDPHLEPAPLQYRKRRGRGRVEADTAPDHLPVSVLDDQPDAVRECGVGAQRGRSSRSGGTRRGTKTDRHQGQSESDA
jgi:hypothetical protein